MGLEDEGVVHLIIGIGAILFLIWLLELFGLLGYLLSFLAWLISLLG